MGFLFCLLMASALGAADGFAAGGLQCLGRQRLGSASKRPCSIQLVTTACSAPLLHDGLEALADKYDAFLIDQWGVMHDGTAVISAPAFVKHVDGRSRSRMPSDSERRESRRWQTQKGDGQIETETLPSLTPCLREMTNARHNVFQFLCGCMYMTTISRTGISRGRGLHFEIGSQGEEDCASFQLLEEEGQLYAETGQDGV